MAAASSSRSAASASAVCHRPSARAGRDRRVQRHRPVGRCEVATRTEAGFERCAALGYRFGRALAAGRGPLQQRLDERRVLGVGEVAVLMLVGECLHQQVCLAGLRDRLGERAFKLDEGEGVVDGVHGQGGHRKPAGRVGIGREARHSSRVGAVSKHSRVQRVVIARADVVGPAKPLYAA